MARKGEIVGGIDFGSNEIRVLIARKSTEGAIQLLGHGNAPSRGCVSQGVIQDLNAAKNALHHALKIAEKEAGHHVSKLFCGVNGKNVETYIREGFVPLEKEIVELGNLEEALDQASRDILAPGKRVISSITSQEWYVDDLRVGDPVGIRGGVLKARVHFALLPAVIEDNLVACIESQGREIEDIVFLPLASGLGCLNAEDIDLGVGVIDLGHTTTSVVVYRDRRIMATYCLDWGGFQITRDVAAILQISFEEAAELVQIYGISDRLIREIAEEEDEENPQPSTAEEDLGVSIKLKTAVRGAAAIVDREKLDMIVFDRCNELMTRVRQYLAGKGLTKNLIRGLVLTGGGASIRNQTALAEAIFGVPARLGPPEGIDVLPQTMNTPEFAPIVGVIRHGFEYRDALRRGRIEEPRGFIGRTVRAIIRFIADYFV